ncbi:MAG: PQQ-binding-like beta-propeller repeat protein [Mycobacteriales bacterium]|nr:PQQ-binding-like beta-propeller repeat protein [Frankia sp.]
MKPRVVAPLALVCSLMAAVLAPAALAKDRGCGSGPVAGGEWPVYGHDAANTRSQPQEHRIGAAQVGNLAPLWSFSTGRPSGVVAGLNFSEFSSTPIVAGSCVFVAASYGRKTGATDNNVYALDTETGKVVWSRYAATDPAGTAGPIIGAPLIVKDKVLVLVNQEGNGTAKGPYVVAYDRRDGHTRWTSPPVVTTEGYYTNASPTLAPGGVVLVGFSTKEGLPDGHGGVALINADTGALLHSPIWSIPPAQWYRKDKTPLYGGGGVWTAPAVDTRNGYAYYGTSNPYSKEQVHPRTNAILKLDVDRTRSTFGEIVASYSGNIEQYVNEVGNSLEDVFAVTCPLYEKSPIQDVPPLDPRESLAQQVLNNSPTCGEQDLDFGAAPNLFPDRAGRLVVGDLQKSGVYHAVLADTMARDTIKNGKPVPATTKPVWQSEVGHSCPACNASSTAFDPATRRVFVAAAPGSVMKAVSVDDVGPNHIPLWSTPIGDGIHYESVSTANGVVYTVDNWGFLDAYDASDGTLLLHRPLAFDASDSGADVVGYSSAGVAIAHHTVFVAAGSHLFAYRL